MTKLNWSVFEPKFGTWAPKIKPFFSKGGFDPIYKVLKEESGKGITIAPHKDYTFRCFVETPLRDLKAVVMGFCPYHTVGVADGLAMSCGVTNVLQPTLEKWYEAMEEELHDGLCLPCFKNPNLEYLARQGVLLFNSAMTTRVGEAGAHQDLWEKFTAYVLGEIISVTGVPVVMLGKQAQEFSGCLAMGQPKWELYHPVYAHRKGIKWDSGGMFKGINEVLRGVNNEQIFWDLPMEDDLPF